MVLVFSNRTSKPPPNGDMWVDSATTDYLMILDQVTEWLLTL